jgi:hypothetical protein
MSYVSADNELVTLINVFNVEPYNQDKLIIGIDSSGYAINVIIKFFSLSSSASNLTAVPPKQMNGCFYFVSI